MTDPTTRPLGIFVSYASGCLTDHEPHGDGSGLLQPNQRAGPSEVMTSSPTPRTRPSGTPIHGCGCGFGATAARPIPWPGGNTSGGPADGCGR